MSSDIRALRELSNDPNGKFLASLARKFSAFASKDQAELVENPEDIYSDGQDFDSVLKYHNFVMTKKFNVSSPVQYYTSSEPDDTHTKLYIGGTWVNLGSKMPDSSYFPNDANIIGDPVIVDGAPFNPGIVDASNDVKSLAVSFNRATGKLVNTERLEIPDNVGLQINGLTTGFTFVIRFRVRSLAVQGSIDRGLMAKVDDSTPTNAQLVRLSTDGRVRVYIQRGGAEVARKQTNAGVIAINNVYTVIVTYLIAGDVLHIYTCQEPNSTGTDQTLSAIAAGTDANYSVADNDMYIFNRGATTQGYIDGDFFFAEWHRFEAVSSTKVANFFINKWTFANIPFGQVNITNYGATS